LQFPGFQLCNKQGKQLATFFPYQKGDIDELSNAISYADEESKQCE